MRVWSRAALSVSGAAIVSCGAGSASWIAGVSSVTGGGPGLVRVVAGGGAGILAGFAGAFLGTVMVGGFVAGTRWFRGATRRDTRESPARARPGKKELLLYASLALAGGMAVVSCGGEPGRGLGNSFPSAVGPLDVGVGMGLVAGAAAGVLTASALRSRRVAVPGSADARLLRCAVAFLPEAARERWHEEWCAELTALTARGARIRFCLSLLVGIPGMAWTLRTATWRRRGG